MPQFEAQIPKKGTYQLILINPIPLNFDYHYFSFFEIEENKTRKMG